MTWHESQAAVVLRPSASQHSLRWCLEVRKCCHVVCLPLMRRGSGPIRRCQSMRHGRPALCAHSCTCSCSCAVAPPLCPHVLHAGVPGRRPSHKTGVCGVPCCEPPRAGDGSRLVRHCRSRLSFDGACCMCLGQTRVRWPRRGHAVRMRLLLIWRMLLHPTPSLRHAKTLWNYRDLSVENWPSASTRYRRSKPHAAGTAATLLLTWRWHWQMGHGGHGGSTGSERGRCRGPESRISKHGECARHCCFAAWSNTLHRSATLSTRWRKGTVGCECKCGTLLSSKQGIRVGTTVLASA